MIYKQPSIYKLGGGGGGSSLNFEDITSQYNIINNNYIDFNLSPLKILYDEENSLVKMNIAFVLKNLSSTSSSDSNYIYLADYTGNDNMLKNAIFHNMYYINMNGGSIKACDIQLRKGHFAFRSLVGFDDGEVITSNTCILFGVEP